MSFKRFPHDRQLDVMECGPSWLKMIAQHFCKIYCLRYFRDKFGITKEGVSYDKVLGRKRQLG
ncbi:cysteine peptidase family C39 domain-containing protein [Pedobacter endophyticus]|uniref:Peptidase C39 domain-containing protein n=1 Tax=Pedobacter endophyticus TaxID=2789740 RepID=A0A7S9KY33_9SPHI|nr:hypothetical protein IZT61_18035 [Pedobacter endophyticus]